MPDQNPSDEFPTPGKRIALALVMNAQAEAARFEREFPEATREMLDAVQAAYLTGAAQVANHLAGSEGASLPQFVQAGLAEAGEALGYSRGRDVPAMVRG
jgi:hypothetical protein